MGLKSSKALAIGSGTLRANLPGAMAIVPLQKSGYFGEKSPSHPKGGNVRILDRIKRQKIHFVKKRGNKHVSR